MDIKNKHKALVMLAQNLQSRHVPIKGLGSMEIIVDETFFEDVELAERRMNSYCASFNDLYLFLEAELGTDADQLFSELLAKSDFLYYG